MNTNKNKGKVTMTYIFFILVAVLIGSTAIGAVLVGVNYLSGGKAGTQDIPWFGAFETMLEGLFGFQVAPAPAPGVEPTAVPPGGEPYYGSVKIKVSETNYINQSSETTSSASYAAYPPGAFPSGGMSISASGTSYGLDRADNGIVIMKLYAGSNHYIYNPALRDLNPRLVTYWWEDITDDGNDDLIAKFDLATVGQVGQGVEPIFTVNLPLIKADTTVTLESLNASTGLGTSENTTTISLDITGLSKATGFMIGRIYIATSEDFEGSKLRLEEMELVGYTLDKNFDYQYSTTGNYTAFYHPASGVDYKEIKNGIWCIRKTDSADKLTVSFTVRTWFSDDDTEYVHLYIDQVGPSSTISTDNTKTYIAED